MATLMYLCITLIASSQGDEEHGAWTMEAANSIFFGMYFDEDSEPDERRYEEVPSMEVFHKLAEASLEDYNSTRRSKMDITLFTFALLHLNRICRIISIQGASALLIGLGGSGRQSLTKLATNMVQTSFFQPEITKSYGANEWHDDIKAILKEAGGMNKHTTFLITENQIKMELFLQDIDCLLNQGEVPNIFPIDEKQEVLEMVRLAAQGGNRNIDVSPLQVLWLVGVEEEMLKAVRNESELSYNHYPTVKRNEWVLEWPQMVVLAVSQVFWASRMHSCLRRSYGGNQTVMNHFFGELTKELNDIVTLVRSPVISNLNRITIKSLIVIDVHAKDVTEELIRLKISSEFDFQWLAQMRYYWEDSTMLVRIINATVPFANEYLGNSDRLVITPLTDRCYRTLVGAYQLHLNGAPEGPAGTGKTCSWRKCRKVVGWR